MKYKVRFIKEYKIEAKVKNFDILHFVADNAGLSTFEAIEKAYNMGISEREVVLDKIRDEIESQREEVSSKHFGNYELQAYYDGLNDGLKDARDILDKYKSESEDKG